MGGFNELLFILLLSNVSLGGVKFAPLVIVYDCGYYSPSARINHGGTLLLHLDS